MKPKGQNTTKTLLLGVLVAVASLVYPMDQPGLMTAEKVLAESQLEADSEALRVETALQLEKLALSKKLAKEIGQNIVKEDNAMMN